MRVGDLNGDGRLDVVALQWNSSSSQDVLLVFLQDSTGPLTAPVGYSAPFGGFNDLGLGDVTGSGKTDVVVMSGQGFGPNVSVLAQIASGTCTAATSYSVTGITDLAGSLGVGDMTGDGHGDIVLGFSSRPRSPCSRVEAISRKRSVAILVRPQEFAVVMRRCAHNAPARNAAQVGNRFYTRAFTSLTVDLG